MLISFLRLKKIAVIAVSVVAIAFMLTHNPLSTTVQAAGTSGSSCTTEGDVPKLHTDGRWFKDEADNLVTLRGISFCGFNNEWGEKVLPDFKSKIAKVTNGTNGWYPKCDSFLINQAVYHTARGTESISKSNPYWVELAL